MSKLIFSIASLVVLGSIPSMAQAFPPQVIVSGTVANSAGLRLSHASISAVPRTEGGKTSSVGSRLNPWTQTDGYGRFSLSLPPGRYKIQAKDEADGYPDPTFMLNDDPTAAFPELVVQQKDISDVRVILGKRGGVLDGKLLDESGNSIVNGKVRISDARSPQAYVEVFTNSDGRFRYAIPGKLIVVSAAAPGFRDATFGQELVLSGGEHCTIVLRLSHN